MTSSDSAPPGGPQPSQGEQPIEIVRRSLEALRFGAIQLTVHEGRVVQIDITEKRRFSA